VDQLGPDARGGNPQATTVRGSLSGCNKSLACNAFSASLQNAQSAVVSVAIRGTDFVAVVDQIRAVDRARFVSKQGKLSDADMSVLEKALKRVLELP